jgi:hypothetical protein
VMCIVLLIHLAGCAARIGWPMEFLLTNAN